RPGGGPPARPAGVRLHPRVGAAGRRLRDAGARRDARAPDRRLRLMLVAAALLPVAVLLVLVVFPDDAFELGERLDDPYAGGDRGTAPGAVEQHRAHAGGARAFDVGHRAVADVDGLGGWH